VRKKRITVTSHESALFSRFGATVKKYRQRLGISQEELAWRAQMHRTYLTDIERGARNLSITSIARLIGALGLSFRDFFSTFDDMLVAAVPDPATETVPAKPLRKRRRSDGRRGRDSPTK
jgi:transcriptional regulator with XRE-family HTH domain